MIAWNRCKRLEREIDQVLVLGDEPGEALTAHLQSCRSCADAWEAGSAIHTRLSSSLSAPSQTEDEFVGEVWQRIRESERMRTPRPILAGLRLTALPVAAAAILGIVLLNRANQSEVNLAAHGPRNNQTPLVSKSPSGPVLARITSKKVKSSSGSAKIGTATQSTKTNRGHTGLSTRRSPRIAPTRNQAPAPEVQQVASSTTPATASWGAYAASLSEQGDYGAAAAAYEREYQSTGNASAIYQAGIHAEAAGDVSSAVKNYIRFLEPTSEGSTRNDGA